VVLEDWLVSVLFLLFVNFIISSTKLDSTLLCIENVIGATNSDS